MGGGAMFKILTGFFAAGLVGWGFFAYQNTIDKTIVAFGDAQAQLASPGDLAWLWGLGALLLAGFFYSAYRTVKGRRDDKAGHRVERAYSN